MQTDAPGTFHIDSQIINENGACRHQTVFLQRVLVDGGVGFQQADLVREYTAVKIMNKRKPFEDVVHMNRIRVG